MSSWNSKTPQLDFIPLTEEWLLKLGFEKHHHHFTSPFKDIGQQRLYLDFNNGVVKNSLNYCTDKDLDLVHQLQNLYQDLIGD